MNEQEKTEWIKRNIDCYSNEGEAREDLEKRIEKKEAKETRVLRVFKNREEYYNYSETHKMGKDWDYIESDFDGEYGNEYEEWVAVCAYEYK